MFSPGVIYRALTDGPMRPMAQGLSSTEKRQIVEYLTHAPFTGEVESQAQLRCEPVSNWFDYGKPPSISGWGMTGSRNTRFIPEKIAELDAESVKRLKLKWVIKFPNTTSARSQPAVAGGAVFVGNQNGEIYALDAKRGCLRWSTALGREVRTAITIDPWKGSGPRPVTDAPSVYFGDLAANAYALNAVTGEIRWKIKLDDHPQARITGSPTLQVRPEGDRLYVPVSSLDGTATPATS